MANISKHIARPASPLTCYVDPIFAQCATQLRPHGGNSSGIDDDFSGKVYYIRGQNVLDF